MGLAAAGRWGVGFTLRVSNRLAEGCAEAELGGIVLRQDPQVFLPGAGVFLFGLDGFEDRTDTELLALL
jgi:hypothetical protein